MAQRRDRIGRFASGGSGGGGKKSATKASADKSPMTHKKASEIKAGWESASSAFKQQQKKYEAVKASFPAGDRSSARRKALLTEGKKLDRLQRKRDKLFRDWNKAFAEIPKNK